MMKSREPAQPITKKANKAFNHPPFLMWFHSARYQKLYENTLNHQGSIQVRSANKWSNKTAGTRCSSLFFPIIRVFCLTWMKSVFS